MKGYFPLNEWVISPLSINLVYFDWTDKKPMKGPGTSAIEMSQSIQSCVIHARYPRREECVQKQMLEIRIKTFSSPKIITYGFRFIWHIKFFIFQPAFVEESSINEVNRQFPYRVTLNFSGFKGWLCSNSTSRTNLKREAEMKSMKYYFY